jgi:hypothetical protein
MAKKIAALRVIEKKEIAMSAQPRFPRLRKYWKPALATGAGGTGLILWFEEIMLFGEEFIAVIFLPILAAVIYIFDILLFRSAKPTAEDKTTKEQKQP